jgi:hypothetical protein
MISKKFQTEFFDFSLADTSCSCAPDLIAKLKKIKYEITTKADLGIKLSIWV